uniref:Uncharacterized protein n=1 Tax=Anguilla anguilla TaxID=7936 RepID=A0A0E9WV08_ANGAN
MYCSVKLHVTIRVLILVDSLQKYNLNEKKNAKKYPAFQETVPKYFLVIRI